MNTMSRQKKGNRVMTTYRAVIRFVFTLNAKTAQTLALPGKTYVGSRIFA
jgi:hypothetical protein